MNILHYTIGLPPERHGGSIQYSYDLMCQQVHQGHNVFALTCGDTLFRGSKCKISKGHNHGILKSYFLTNPTTPTLLYGVKEPDSQLRNVNIDTTNIDRFIQQNSIEVFHIHTFMGLPKNVTEYIKSLGVKIVFTTHDFYGICAKNNLLDFNGKICWASSPERCAKCCYKSPSDSFLRICNSSLYHWAKRFKLPKKNVVSKIASAQEDVEYTTTLNVEKYNELISYYGDYFRLIDLFHFNSSQTQEVYKKHLPDIHGYSIPVTTAKIADRRKPLSLRHKLTFGFIGSLNEYKGFALLKDALVELYNEGYKDFKLKVYGTANEGKDADADFIEYCGHYRYEELSSILYHLDGTIVPSKCYETFSLITLESLAHGVPTIVSSTVGAKELVEKIDNKFIFTDKESLKNLLRQILSNHDLLKQFNKRLMEISFDWTIKEHTKEILQFYSLLFRR